MQILKRNPLFAFVSVCFILSYFSVKAQPTLKTLNLQELIQKVEIAKRYDFVYYQLQVPTNYDGKEDLIIKAMPLDPDSDPDIFISKTVRYPNSSDTSDWQCAAYGRDTCEILHKNISKSDTFYIGMTCISAPCKFQVYALLSGEFVLEDGVQFQTYMHSQEAKVFKYRVQPSTSSENQTIMVKAAAYSGSSKAFNIRVQRLDDDVSDKYQNVHSKMGQPAWKKGQVVRISQNDDYLWCTDCYLTVVLDVQDEGYYHLVATTTGVAPLVYNGIQVDDMVGYGERQCYQYYVKSEETDLQVTLTTYSGHVNITAHPGSLPEKQQDFMFRPEFEETSKILDLGKWLRAHRAQQPKGLYFICAYGIFTSTYTLKIREFEKDHQKLYVEDSYSERFFLPGGGFTVLMYEVPKLEYLGEDIKITATLQTRRQHNNSKPIFVGAMCDVKDPEECRNNVTKEAISVNGSFTKALDKGHFLQLVIDHDEQKCNKKFNGECYYALAVQNPSDRFLLYELIVQHSQNNHIMLEEGKPYIDNVDLHSFKYYKFSIFDTGIQNVTYQLSPMHGDSDIYVSRNYSFPNKTNWEKRGARAGVQGDYVSYKAFEDGNLNQTYYVGVYGYTYASYSISVNVVRTAGSTSGSHSVEQVIQNTKNHLIEGVSMTKTLHNELDMFLGFFEVDISDDYDPAIIINIWNTQGKSHMYVKYGELATPTNFDYDIVDGSIRIKAGDRAYHKKGIYYVGVMPKFGFWDLFTDDYYTFSVTHWIETTVSYLTQHERLPLIVPPREYRYVKHYVAQVDQSIKLIFTNGGQSDLYVSIDPTNQKPTESNSDFSTKFIYGGNYTNVKSIYIPALLLQMKNPACVDLGYAEDEPCVINIGVYCNQGSDCSGTFTVDYESQYPTLISAGQAKHSTIQQDSWIYYYMTVTQANIGDIYAVLTPLNGDLDLYVSFERDYEAFSSWSLPTDTNYDLQSKNKLKTEMIHISEPDLRQCFINNQTMNNNCIIIFGIYANPAYFVNKNQTSLLYNFIAYKNIIEIRDRNPISAFVQDKQMTYFIYHESCSNCTLIISLSSYSSGDPDLYIVKGDRLPTLNDYDIKKATLHSEVVQLNLETDFFIDNKLTSMEGYYTIGVYGNRNTTFSLSVSSQELPIIQLTEGIEIMQYQKPYEASFYQFYNWYDKDLEIQTTVQKGSIDILVNTYYQQDQDQNFLDLLPESKGDVRGWSVLDIDSQNYNDGKELLIMREDRKFCFDCYYLIGILTHEESARFNLLIKALDAEQSYQHLLKIGETKTIRFNETSKVQVYQFMLENKAHASIVPTVLSGQVKMTLSFGENKELPITELHNGQTYILNEKYLKTDVNYYLTLESLSDKAELTIGIQQKASVINLKDGVPQILEYTDNQDISKYMLFDVAKGTSTVMFSVKSKTKGFFPVLAYSIFFGEDTHDKTFPPSELQPYEVISSWDYDLYLMKATINFNDLPEDAILALNLVNRNPKSTYNFTTSSQAIITVSNSQVIKLIEEEEYFSEFKTDGAKFNAFKVQPPSDKKLVVEFSQCSGLLQYTVLTNLTDLHSKVTGEMFHQRGLSQQVFPKSNKPYFIMVEPLQSVMDTGKSEYTIKIRYLDQNQQIPNSKFIASNDGHIEIEFLRGRRGEFKLKWGPMYEYRDAALKQLDDVRYQIVASTEPNARMDSICVIKRSSSTFKFVDEISNAYEITLPRVKPGEETYLNIIAISEDKQIQYPYQPLTVTIPARMSIGGRWAIYISTFLIVIFVALACFFYKKSQKLQRRLQFEINEVQTSSGDVERYRRVGGAKTDNYGHLGEEKDDE